MPKEYKLVKLIDDVIQTEAYDRWVRDQIGEQPESPRPYDVPEFIYESFTDRFGKVHRGRKTVNPEFDPSVSKTQEEAKKAHDEWGEKYNAFALKLSEFFDAIDRGEISPESLEISYRFNSQIQTLSLEGWSFVEFQCVPQVTGSTRISNVSNVVTPFGITSQPTGGGGSGYTSTTLVYILLFEREV